MQPEQLFCDGVYGGYAPPLILVSVGTTLTLSFPPTITYKNLLGTLPLDKVP